MANLCLLLESKSYKFDILLLEEEKYIGVNMKKISKILILLLSILLFSACQKSKDENMDNDYDFGTNKGSRLIKIVSGSENKELEPLFDKFSKKENIKIQIEYKGSLDIMRDLADENIEYDAVFPASSIWLNIGDKNHILKHQNSISQSPVIFAIKKSKAKELGFIGKDVSVRDIMQTIKDGKLSFAMTNASQSNSGSSAYLGFLTALSGKEVLDLESLDDEGLRKDIKDILMGVNRSSGSSNWLVDLFLSSDYDAMVNYETLVIKTNEELKKAGKEELFMVYPYDGMALADSPLAYVDKNDKAKEEDFIKLQEFLLSPESQDFIEKTGRRNAFGKVSDTNKDVFDKDLGAKIDRDISYIKYPQAEVIEKALDLYQISFKKPAYTYYVLDYSGSMSGAGNEEMMAALNQLFIPENAKKHLLLGTSEDITKLLAFSTDIITTKEARGNSDQIEELYNIAKDIRPDGGTSLYFAVLTALKDLESKDLDGYSPAIIVLSDGMAGDKIFAQDIEEIYKNEAIDIPIFSIKFGDAQDEDLDFFASISRGKVFDGKDDLSKTFREVKAYN